MLLLSGCIQGLFIQVPRSSPFDITHVINCTSNYISGASTVVLMVVRFQSMIWFPFWLRAYLESGRFFIFAVSVTWALLHINYCSPTNQLISSFSLFCFFLHAFIWFCFCNAGDHYRLWRHQWWLGNFYPFLFCVLSLCCTFLRYMIKDNDDFFERLSLSVLYHWCPSKYTSNCRIVPPLVDCCSSLVFTFTLDMHALIS